MGITFRSFIRIAYKTPIRNRHSEAPVAPLLPQMSFRGQKTFVSRCKIAILADDLPDFKVF
ncbi:hypothetical protein Taro_010209 [Colocasia esculenta]|uniref:Uncharacterized protein n=1 Tax=Colocasia esculenta TaxID=4460 RepID=A0A843U2P6_COLES|nr:hypothetical protein [Colocasia esculenta]